MGDALLAKLRAAQVIQKQPHVVPQQDIDSTRDVLASTQDVSVQLRAAQEMIANSMAQVSRQIDQERIQRASDVDVLKQELASTKFMIAQMAEKILGGNVEASLQELKKTIAAQQAQQDLHAGALREGLIDIREQRAALGKLVDHGMAFDGKGFDGRGHGSSAAVVELRSEVADVRASMDAMRSNLCDQVGNIVKDLEDRLFEVTQESVAEVAAQRLTEIVQAGIARHQREELTTLVEEQCARFIELRASRGALSDANTSSLHAEVAAELANVVSHTEKQCRELVAAIEMERAARMTEAADLRALMKTAVDRFEGRHALASQLTLHTNPVGSPSSAPTRELDASHGQNLMGRLQYQMR